MKIVRDRPVQTAATAAAIVLTIAFGVGGLGGWLTTRVGYLAVPSAVGVPFGLPGLRLWPLGDTGWWFTGTETLAAAGFIALILWWVTGTVARHQDAGPVRLLVSGWLGAVIAAAGANVWRVVVASFAQESGISVYIGHLIAGALFGAVWGLALGWIVGVAALAARRRTPGRAAEPGENQPVDA